MKKLLLLMTLLLAQCAWAGNGLLEPHDRLAPQAGAGPRVALTLDACGGEYDGALIEFLIRNRVPATIFATRKWLDRNPAGLAVIKTHLDLFDVEDHGENHIPAVIGAGRRVYGIAGEPDIGHLQREVAAGAHAVAAATGIAPRYYRGATAIYDAQALETIGRMGYSIAGFSVNADDGATLNRGAIEARLRSVRDGDVIIAHMNRPASDSAEGLAAGLSELLRKGYAFVRLDQADLVAVQDNPVRNVAKLKKQANRAGI